jgi:FGGY-family pentulose kinase
MEAKLYLGIDVGTASVRAALFDDTGRRLGLGVHPIQIFRPAEDFVEQSSDDIWQAAGIAVRAALAESGASAEQVFGIGFDATCSLVALDAADKPVTVSPSGRDQQNVVVWMDHRAIEQARRINDMGHAVLRYVGGVISPEMQTPKLLWLKEQLKPSYDRTARFLDLPDFLSYRATGIDTRSLCTTVCKWTYLGKEGRFDDSYFQSIGLSDLAADGYARIGQRVRPIAERVGGLSERAARELGLKAGTAVGVGIIDAHAGGIGLLGAVLASETVDSAALERRLALIGGTSSCHMAVSREPRFVPGIWGPYYSAMVPGMWLTEGGQSATGALIDHVIRSHAQGAKLEAEASRQKTSVYALLNERLDALSRSASFPAELTREIHVLPYFHGNRSPRADPSLRGMVSGLKLSDDVDALALVYLATIQAVAHGTRHIIETMNAHGYAIETVLACGGDMKNSVFVREHADISGCRVVLPREPEAVLLGAAILGVVAAGDRPSVLDAMRAMSAVEKVIEPARGPIAQYHERKHAVFQRMYQDFIAYRGLMSGGAGTRNP